MKQIGTGLYTVYIVNVVEDKLCNLCSFPYHLRQKNNSIVACETHTLHCCI